MASRIIFTGMFRASHVHFDEPHRFDAKQDLKYSTEALFSKVGTSQLPQLAGPINTSVNPIWQALSEVIAEEWGVQLYDGTQYDPCGFADWCKTNLGIQLPPQLKDGDTKVMKDERGNPLPGQFDPITQGMIRVNLANKEKIGTVGPNGDDIDPSSVYSGCWGRAQVEVSAYSNKENGSRILSIRPLNFQMAYEGENIGGRTVVQAASTAFAGMAVADTNIQVGYGQSGTIPQVNAPAPVTPAPAAPAPAAPAAPAAAPAPAAPAAAPAPAAPVAAPAPAAPVAAPAPAAPVAAPAPAAPVAAPAVNTTDGVILSDALVAQGITYPSMVAQGWTDEAMITSGHGTPNFNKV